jgi:hypothetical protein
MTLGSTQCQDKRVPGLSFVDNADLCCLLIYCQSFPNFCNHKKYIGVTVCFPVIVYRIYWNAISYLSICYQSGHESSDK